MTGIAFADALDGFLSFVQGAISVHTEAILTESSVQSIMPLVALQHSIAPISDILARLAELCGYVSMPHVKCIPVVTLTYANYTCLVGQWSNYV
jgi:hypothetical protein